MISPIISTQNSASIAAISHNTDSQAAIQGQFAHTKVQENERQIRESVVKKDEAVFYEQNHDAKEEGRNKYSSIYSKKKKNNEEDEEKKDEVTRVNFDLRI